MQNLLLSDMRQGQRGTVTAIRLSGGFRQRLRDLGLIEDTEVTCMHIAPAGSPMAFWIRGAVIALRREDCAAVSVTGVA